MMVAGGDQGSKGEGVTGYRARTRARLDDCAFIADGAIETSRSTIRLRQCRRKRSQCVRLQTLTMQGKIGNLVNGEVGQLHCLQDLHVWPVFEILDILLDLIWIDRS